MSVLISAGSPSGAGGREARGGALNERGVAMCVFKYPISAKPAKLSV